MPIINWDNISNIGSRNFTCGFCGQQIASNRGFHGREDSGHHHHIFLCHFCHKPNYLGPTGEQAPGAVFGDDIQHIPDESVENLYNEARSCMKVNAHTAAILCSRKLLMNIAVSLGPARENH